MKLPLPLKIAFTVVLVGAAIWLGTSAHFYKTALLSLFFGVTLASVILIHFRVRPSLPDALSVLGGGLAFAAIDFGALHFLPSLAGIASFLGIASMLVLGLRAIWSSGPGHQQIILAFVPALLFVCSDWASTVLLRWTERAHPDVLDLSLLSFDSSLRVLFEFLLGQAYAMWPWFKVAGLVFYIGLPMVIALVYAGQLLRDKMQALSAMIAFLITGPIGVIFYNLFPAVGPIHLFARRFPWSPLSADELARLVVKPIPLAGLRNCMPSLHMGWVLLAWWYSKGLSWWERGIAMLFVVFTVFATLGTGEHYAVDLVVAFPFVVFLQGLCALRLRWNDPARVFAVGYGLLVTLAWIAALRFALKLFWLSPALPWTCCILTVASAILVRKRLEAATAESALALTVACGQEHAAVS
jgi:PAP2 superfamily